MYTTHTPFWDAKNRYGLADELPFSFDSIRHIFEAEPVKVTSPSPAVSPMPAPVPAQEELPKSKSPEKPKAKKETAGAAPKNAGKPVPVKQETPPEIVTDESLDKRIPKALRDLMIAGSIGEWDLNAVVQARQPGAFPPDMAVKDYPQDFIDEWVLPNWDKIVDMVKKMRDELEIPFN